MTLGSRRSAGTRAILRELPAPVLGPLAQAPSKATAKIRNRVKSSSRTRALVQVEEGHSDQSNSWQNHPHHQVLRQARDRRSSSVGTAIAGTQRERGQSPAHRLPSEEGEEAEEEQAETQATGHALGAAPEEERHPSATPTGTATRSVRARSSSQVSLAAPSSSSSSPAGRLTAVDPGLITVCPQAHHGPISFATARLPCIRPEISGTIHHLPAPSLSFLISSKSIHPCHGPFFPLSQSLYQSIHTPTENSSLYHLPFCHMLLTLHTFLLPLRHSLLMLSCSTSAAATI